MACLQVVLACALGIPLSWHKMLLGTFVKWIGWQLDVRGVPRAVLPEDKVTVICLALRRICRGIPISRRELESLIGRLLWFTGGMRWLRPWMSTWFRMASKPTLRFLHLDWGQVDELLELLGEDLRVCRHARFSDARCGWRLLERGGPPTPDACGISCSKSICCRQPRLPVQLNQMQGASRLKEAQEETGNTLFLGRWLYVRSMGLPQFEPRTPIFPRRRHSPRIQLHAYRTFGGSPANSV